MKWSAEKERNGEMPRIELTTMMIRRCLWEMSGWLRLLILRLLVQEE